MDKIGQITLFIILGVLILIIVIILVFLMKVQVETSTDISENIDISQTKLETDNIIQTCLNDISENAVWVAGEHGGYALQHNLLYFCEDINNNFFIDYVYTDQIGREYLDDYTYFGIRGRSGINPIPLDKIEDDSRLCLESFIKVKLTNCINDFVSLQNKGWLIDYNVEKVNADLGEQVVVELLIPGKFIRDNQVFQIDKYSYTINFNFPLMFQQVEYAANNCNSDQYEQIENVIENNVKNDGYSVFGFERNKDDLANAYQYIIKKGDYRFKFGIAC